jgi:hypothetical protein
MKLILDFDTPLIMQITSTDDEKHYYSVAWKTDKTMSVWYDGIFFKEYKYSELSIALGQIVGLILLAIKVRNVDMFLNEQLKNK